MGALLPWVSALDLVLGLIFALVVAAIMAALRQPVREWIENQFFGFFPRFDFVLGIVAFVVSFVVLQTAGLMGHILSYLKTDGTAAYGAMLGASTALLGFAATVLAIVCTVVPTTQLRARMTSDQYLIFMNAFTITIRSLGACTLLCLIALFLNYAPPAREALFFATFFTVAVTVPGLVRSALALEQVVRVVGNLPAAGRTHRPRNKPVPPATP
jgi:hypothetical protein